MKVAIIGVVDFSLEMLKIIFNSEVEIVGVLTKEKSNFNSDFADLSSFCIKNNIDWKYFDNINDKENIEWLKNKQLDYIFCLGLSQIIHQELLDVPKFEVIGYHPALIPQNRGRHPLIWSIILGLKETGSTFFFMDNGADTGDILNQHKILLSDDETSKSLYVKIISTAKIQINEIIPSLINNDFSRIKQDERNANYWRKRDKKDGVINFNCTSITIDRLVRALGDPYVGANVVFDNQEIKVWETKLASCSHNNIEPGKVLDVNNNKILIKTIDSAIWLTKHEFITLPEIGNYIN